MWRDVFSALRLYPFAIAILPACAIAFIPVDEALQRGIYAALCLGLSLLFAAIAMFLSKERAAISFPSAAFSIVPFVLFAILSFSVGHLPLITSLGLGFEIGTLGSFVLLGAAVVLGSLLSLNDAVRMCAVYACAVCATAIIGFSIGHVASLHSYATWPDIAFALTSVVIVSAILSDARSDKRLAWGAGTLAALILFVCMPQAQAASIGAAVLVVVGSISWLSSSRIPIASIFAAVVLTLVVVSGFSGFFAPPSELRLNAKASQIVGELTYFRPGMQSLIGSGPDTFSVAWERGRPISANQTPLWSTSVREGYSTLYTWLVTLGFGGIALFFVPLVMLLGAIATAAWEGRWTVLGSELWECTGIACFVYAAAAIYTIDLPLLLMMGAALGISCRILDTTPPVPYSARGSDVRAGFVAAGAFTLLFVASTQGIAAWMNTRAHVSHDAGLYSEARSASAMSTVWPVVPYLLDASLFEFDDLAHSKVDQQTALIRMNTVHNYAGRALSADPKGYTTTVTAASVYTGLVLLGNTEDAQNAEDLAAVARRLAPNRPEAPYVLANLYAHTDRTNEAAQLALASLKLKSDFDPARELLIQLGVQVAP